LPCTRRRTRSCHGVAVTVLITPPLGRRGMVVMSTHDPSSCGHIVGPLRSSGREKNHVVAKACGHELEDPKPDHRGAWNRQNRGSHPKNRRKIVSKHVGPLPSAPTVGVLTQGVTPMSEFMCVFSFPDGDAIWTQGFILVLAREGPTSSGGRVCIILHLSACTGVNTRKL